MTAITEPTNPPADQRNDTPADRGKDRLITILFVVGYLGWVAAAMLGLGYQTVMPVIGLVLGVAGCAVVDRRRGHRV